MTNALSPSGVTTPPFCVPSRFEMSTAETWSLACDVTANIQGVTDTITDAACELSDLTIGEPVTLTSSPSVLLDYTIPGNTTPGNYIVQVVVGSLLTPGHIYLLGYYFMANTNKNPANYILISCTTYS